MADRSNIGKTGKPFKMPNEWSKVREFARAIKDPNPLYFDPELGVALKLKSGGEEPDRPALYANVPKSPTGGG